MYIYFLYLVHILTPLFLPPSFLPRSMFSRGRNDQRWFSGFDWSLTLQEEKWFVCERATEEESNPSLERGIQPVCHAWVWACGGRERMCESVSVHVCMSCMCVSGSCMYVGVDVCESDVCRCACIWVCACVRVAVNVHECVCVQKCVMHVCALLCLWHMWVLKVGEAWG